MCAAQHNTNAEIITALVQEGADVNACDEYGRTALMHAAKSNSNAEVITALLAAGCSTQIKDKNGMTALHYSKKNTHLKYLDEYWEIVDALREC